MVAETCYDCQRLRGLDDGSFDFSLCFVQLWMLGIAVRLCFVFPRLPHGWPRPVFEWQLPALER